MKRWFWMGGVFMMTCQAWAVPAEVTFRVAAAAVPEGKAVHVSGNLEELGNWSGAGLELVREESGVWAGAISVPRGTPLEFKVTLGSWADEALDAEGNVPDNHTLTIQEDRVVEIEVPAWKAPAEIRGQVTGTVEVHAQLEGEGLLPRDVQVWLPPSYATHPNRRYPVLYMHDGQQVFDPATSTFGVDWGVDETATRLIEEKKLREIIVVAINNTSRRGDEYADGELGRLYMNFIVNRLKPFIDETYRTLPEREHTGTIGASMGGLISFLLVYRHGDVFSMAGCLSPAFFLDFRELRQADWPKQPTLLYIDNGGVGLEQMLQPGCDLMLETLPAKGFDLGRNLFWIQDRTAEHNEAAWAERVWMPLSMMYGRGAQRWKARARNVPTPVYADWDLEPDAIVEVASFHAVGLEERVGGPNMHEEVMALWERFSRSAGLLNAPRNPETPEYVGVTIPGTYWRDTHYLAGLVVADDSAAPEHMAARQIDGGRYLQFTHTGPASALKAFFEYLYRWWIPRSDFRMGQGSIELYGADYRPDADDAVMTILLPLDEE